MESADPDVRECEACGQPQVFLLNMKDSECGQTHRLCEECSRLLPDEEFWTKRAWVLEFPKCPLPWFVMRRFTVEDDLKKNEELERYVVRYRKFLKGGPGAV